MTPGLKYYPPQPRRHEEEILIPYISVIPFTDVIHMLSEWILVGTAVIIVVGIGLPYYQARRSEDQWEVFRGEVLRRLPPTPAEDTPLLSPPPGTVSIGEEDMYLIVIFAI